MSVITYVNMWYTLLCLLGTLIENNNLYIYFSERTRTTDRNIKFQNIKQKPPRTSPMSHDQRPSTISIISMVVDAGCRI